MPIIMIITILGLESKFEWKCTVCLSKLGLSHSAWWSPFLIMSIGSTQSVWWVKDFLQEDSVHVWSKANLHICRKMVRFIILFSNCGTYLPKIIELKKEEQ
jgi:hypothetical protein